MPALSPELAAALERARIWNQIRLRPRQAKALLVDFAERGDSTSRPVALSTQEAVVALVGDVDWPKVGGARLIALVEEYLALSQARDTFLPPAFRPSTEGSRWSLLLHELWRRAETLGHDAGRALSLAIGSAYAGAAAFDEVRDRYEKHVGMDAAVYLLLLAWEGAPAPDRTERATTLRGLRDRFRQSSTRSVRGSLRPEATHDEVDARAQELLWERYGRRQHPLDLLATALDGGLNVSPKKVGNEVSRHLTTGLPTSRSRQKNRRITFEMSATPVEPEQQPGNVEEQLNNAILVKRLREADPGLVDALLRNDANITAVAAELGLSRPTIYKRLGRIASEKSRR